MIFAQLVETTTTTTTNPVWYITPFMMFAVFIVGGYCKRVSGGAYRLLRHIEVAKGWAFLVGVFVAAVVGGFLGLSALGFVLFAQTIWGEPTAARDLSALAPLVVGAITGTLFGLGGPIDSKAEAKAT